jgi:hypothetical protein
VALAFKTTFQVPRPKSTLAALVAFVSSPCLFGLADIVDRWFGATSGLSGRVLGAAVFITAFAAMAVSAFALFRANQRVGGLVRIDGEGLRLGEVSIPRARIRGGYHRPGAPEGVMILLDKSAVPVAIDVEDRDQAYRVLEELGVGATQRSVPFAGVAPTRSVSAVALWTGMIAGVALLALSLPLHAAWLGVLGVAIVVASFAFVGATFHVGADGVLVKHRLGERFVPWSDVRAVGPYRRGVLLVLDGERLALPTTPHVIMFYDNERAMQAALLLRMRDALAAHRFRGSSDAAERIARRGRPAADWVRDLFHREGDFRQAPLLDDDLWRVVESTTADATARAAAAAILAQGGGDGARERLRISAAACAAPKLRIALDRAASGATDEQMADALAEVEDPAKPRLRNVVSAR